MRPPAAARLRRAPLAAGLALLAACGGGEGEPDGAAPVGDALAADDEASPDDAGLSPDGIGQNSPYNTIDFELPFEDVHDPRVDAIGRVVEDVTVRAADGTEHPLLAGRAEPWLVLAFTQVGCPIAMRYGSELAALYEEFGPLGVGFVGVDASPQDSPEEIEAQREQLGIPFPIHEDDAQALVRQLDVRTTTEVLVLDAERRLRYRGGVSDRLDVGVARGESDRDRLHLRAALDALLAGGAPPLQVTAAPGCVLTRLLAADFEPELPERVTYHEHVAPILQEKCAPCHRPGQAAPFALETYDDAFGWSGMIEQVVADGLMPPWPVPRRFDGDFANARGLTALQEALILRWIETGAEEGDPALAPPPPQWPEDWTLDGIDLVVEADQQLEFVAGTVSRTPLPEEGFYVPRDRTLEYQDLSSSYVFRRERWVTGVEVRAEAPTVVHHVGVFTLPADGRRRRARGARDASSDLGAGYFGLYGPGASYVEYPKGTAKRIPAGSFLRFQVHYTTDGAEHWDRPSIALRFADSPPPYEVRTGSAANSSFVLAPHAADVEVRAGITLPVDTSLVTLMPHMHYRGEHFRFFLREPNGQVRTLLSMPFDFNWQMELRLADPIRMPAGTQLLCVGVMDNSEANPWNPDPDAEVRFGRQSWDEMFLGYFDYAVPTAAAQRPGRRGGGR